MLKVFKKNRKFNFLFQSSDCTKAKENQVGDCGEGFTSLSFLKLRETESITKINIIEIMELKSLENYTKRELLELIVSNQVRSEQRIYKIYTFLFDKYEDDFSKNNQHKGKTFEDFLDSFDGLDKEIRNIIDEQEG